mgnify:CR=1 FL=1
MPAADLVVLAADGNIKTAVEGILTRHAALGIRKAAATFYVHPERDPGCLLRSDSFLRQHAGHFRHALVVFDREGCGNRAPAAELGLCVESKLAAAGWGQRAAAIVCDPEVDRWVWSTSPHVEDKLGWKGRSPALRDWLLSQQFPDDAEGKPARPKEALQAALRVARKPRSSSIDGELARSVSFQTCKDAAFMKLIERLRVWFP